MLQSENYFFLSERVRTSRMLGQNKSLVLHGGGNTSVKIIQKNILSEDEEILFVKGSGWDLETITVQGFSPVRLEHLKALSKLPILSDSAMVNEMVTHLTRSSAPIPSVEAILHAVIPFKFVDHTHADAVVAISNSVNGERIIRDLYGNQVIYIPYVMPGFDLSRNCSIQLAQELTEDKIGMILLNHGVFSFGSTADESYNRMIELVLIAENYLNENAKLSFPSIADKAKGDFSLDLVYLRREIARVAGFPIILKSFRNNKSMHFCNRPDLEIISQQGPATPDHVIRTKRLPMIGKKVEEYAENYRKYFQEYEPLSRERKKMLDAAPRVVLDPQLGLCTIGRTAKDAQIVADIYSHTIDIISWATLLGGYKALPAKDIFDVEYWELEQAKLAKSGDQPEFTGEIALVTGAASGIGKACVSSLIKRGAAVVGLDINPAIKELFTNENFLGITCDVTSESQLKEALRTTACTFGGLDMLVLNAGIFPPGNFIETLKSETWQKVMDININANFVLLREAFPFLKAAPNGGRVVIVGSKNVPAPGPGAAAYSASKAALNQLARVAALEWGAERIRVNSVHPNAVFDTGIWTEEILTARAKNYGLTPDQYKKNNILKTEVTSRDVSEMVAGLCSSLFSKTTGAQIPIDGGNDRVI